MGSDLPECECGCTTFTHRWGLWTCARCGKRYTFEELEKKLKEEKESEDEGK